MCIRDRDIVIALNASGADVSYSEIITDKGHDSFLPVSYTHLRAHETSLHLVCRLLLEKKKETKFAGISQKCAGNDKMSRNFEKKCEKKIRKMLEISRICEKFSFFISFFHSSP